MFIKLTEYPNDNDIWVNPSQIFHMKYQGHLMPKRTIINMIGRDSFCVLEAPEEINAASLEMNDKSPKSRYTRLGAIGILPSQVDSLIKSSEGQKAFEAAKAKVTKTKQP